MSFERAKYVFPIEGIAYEKADAPAGVYLLDGAWHLAAHESAAENRLINAGALLIATLSFNTQIRSSVVYRTFPQVHLHQGVTLVS